MRLHLAERGMLENEEKRYYFTVKHDGDDKWKDVILLGTKLDTERDIIRRKGLASAAWYKNIKLLTSKSLPLLLRVQYFQAFVSSIFLYQCGTWTLPQYLNHKIDVFQRDFLRRIVGIKTHKGKNISNDALYKITQQKPWSETCRYRRLTLFGHTCRLPEGAPSKETLNECLRPYKRLVGGQKTTLLGTIKEDFNLEKISISEAQQIAQSKREYQNLVDRLMSRKKEGQQCDTVNSDT